MPPPATRMAEPLYKKPFLKSVTESGMTPALTGSLPSSATKVQTQKIPVLVILTLVFPPPSPCLALPSPFPPRPPVLCGKISQYLVVCSPGHHQVFDYYFGLNLWNCIKRYIACSLLDFHGYATHSLWNTECPAISLFVAFYIL